MINPPLVFKTYQDVKNNLAYWTTVILVVLTLVVYFVVLGANDRQSIDTFVSSMAGDPVRASLWLGLIGLAEGVIAILLIHVFQIHDVVYDGLIIKWRERYDVEFILPKLTEPIAYALPKNFSDYAVRYRYNFMKPYYDLVGDEKPGITVNARVRFYERITLYWITQLNEIFILLLIIITSAYVIFFSSSLTLQSFAVLLLVLIGLGILNRWFIRITRKAVAQATLDEIEEIHAIADNIPKLQEQYKKLCDSHKI